MKTISDVILELVDALKMVGIQSFFAQTYKGREDIERWPPCWVGVYSGYVPGKAAIYTCVFRFHPESPEDDHFVLEVISQHEEDKLNTGARLEQIVSTRIYDPIDRPRICGSYHMLPVFHLDHWYGRHCYWMGQSICCVDQPIEDKVAYTSDIFSSFSEKYGDTLLPKFTQFVEPYVAPYWSKEFNEELGDDYSKERELNRRHLEIAFSEIQKEQVEDPLFPLFIPRKMQ